MKTPETSHAWRGHEILRLRYLEGIDVRSILDRLALSRSEYYRDHRRAIAATAAILSQRWGVAGGEPPVSTAERGHVEPVTQARAEQTIAIPSSNLPSR